MLIPETIGAPLQQGHYAEPDMYVRIRESSHSLHTAPTSPLRLGIEE